jgi:phosphohistidine swiveling domain-containing protein
MKTNILRKKLALVSAGLSVVGFLDVVAYAQSIPTILGFGDTHHSRSLTVLPD